MDDFYEPGLSSIEEKTEDERESDTDNTESFVELTADSDLSVMTNSPPTSDCEILGEEQVDLDIRKDSDSVGLESLEGDDDEGDNNENDVFLSENKIGSEENKENRKEESGTNAPRIRKISTEILKRVIHDLLQGFDSLDYIMCLIHLYILEKILCWCYVECSVRLWSVLSVRTWLASSQRVRV